MLFQIFHFEQGFLTGTSQEIEKLRPKSPILKRQEKILQQRQTICQQRQDRFNNGNELPPIVNPLEFFDENVEKLTFIRINLIFFKSIMKGTLEASEYSLFMTCLCLSNR